MSPRDCIALTLTIILGILAVNVHAGSWDLAVVSKYQIEFLMRNKTSKEVAEVEEAVSLSAAAYDDVTDTMYVSDRGEVAIFSGDATENLIMKPLLSGESRNCILGLAFDTKNRNLIWSDAEKNVIKKMHVPLDGPPEKPIVLHNLPNRIPRGIALDMCNSHIYWVNSNSTNATIDRSNLDGTNHITVHKDNMYLPIAVAIDHAEQKLYWIDDIEGIRMTIERSNLDGSERHNVVYATHQEPTYLAVDHDSIYWSDVVSKTIWTVPKNSVNNEPTIFKEYKTSGTSPAAILARDNTGNTVCSVIPKTTPLMNLIHSTPAQSTAEPYNDLAATTEESKSTTETSRYCLNGRADGKDGTCRCKLGFIGTHCETDLCRNYCFRGKCSVTTYGYPTCKCSGTFVGARCETDVCKDYCLHGGQCSIQNGKPVCQCKHTEGPRCENLNITQICETFCTTTESVPTDIATNCRCAESNPSTAQSMTFRESVEYKTLLPIFSGIIVVLILLVTVLSYYVNKLRRRPRIKKRFVVSKGGVTPLTSRPQLPDNQCEITIENCCNMNICETPCFEPKLRTPPPNSNRAKKEEKNFLLDNMEGNSC